VFVDTGVLITAFRGQSEMREHALAVLSEPNLEFWYSPLLRLETVLQAAHHGRKLELAFYAAYFKQANCFGDLNRIFEIGQPDALKHGIPVMDALHVAAANLARCKVLFTTESPTKPLFRTKLVQVASILTPITKNLV
jgi:predicted nucleic acid-binding protein